MISVLVVDDSPLFRRVLTEILSADPEIGEVVTAGNGQIALKKLERMQPDVITMDLQMPGLHGLDVIEKIMTTNPIPIIIITASAGKGPETGLRAIELGVVDLLEKPGGTHSARIMPIRDQLIDAVKNAASVKLGGEGVSNGAKKKKKREPRGVSDRSFKLVAIGGSTGGPIAVRDVLTELPADFAAPIIIVLHMPPAFTSAYAKRLDSLCPLDVKEAEDGDPVVPGSVLIAPGDRHLTVDRVGVRVSVRLDSSEKVNNHRPSIDVMMSSIASAYGKNTLAVIMTGMGSDGAHGISDIKKKGGYVIAQDEASSVIYGMNRVIVKNGHSDEVVPLHAIAGRLIALSTPVKGA